MAKSKSAYGHDRGKPHPVDIHVGTRVRARRTLLGMTQTGLGDAIDVTFQQMQKYEKGTNRISASRLYGLAGALDVPVDYFFDKMLPVVTIREPAKRRGKVNEPVSSDPNLMARRETLEFVRGYYKIRDPQSRKRIYELTKVLGAADG
jgi:transcriptional regulator with XRE-family HTH domain